MTVNRRDFIKKTGILGIGSLVFTLLPSQAAYFYTGTNRWIWMHPDRTLTDDAWLNRFTELKNHGINGVLFMVYGSHKAYYKNPQLPVEEDILNRVIPLAAKAGIELHGWMWTMPNNNPDYARDHPDWFVVNREGQPAHTHPAYVGYYKFMCPNHPEVRDFLHKNVSFLASIEGLAGVHLDYSRMPDVLLAEALHPKYNSVQDKDYPADDYCYCPNCRRRFRELTGKDPLIDLPDPASDKEWRQFRFDSVTSLVNEVLAPAIHTAGKTASAAVFPNYDSVRQEWMRWELDTFFPMLYHNFYNADIHWIEKQIRRFRKAVPESKQIYAGLFIPALTPEELEIVENQCHSAGAAGVSLFDFNAMTNAHWDVLH